MSPAERALYERMLRQMRAAQPELADRLIAAFDAIRLYLTQAELAEAVRNHTLEALIQEIASDKALDPAFAPLRQSIDEAVLNAGKVSIQEIPVRFRPKAFNLLNDNVVQAAHTLDTRVIRGLQEDVRAVIRKTVENGIMRGDNPRKVARNIREYVGLSPKQAEWIDRFRVELNSGDRDALNRVLGRGVIRQPNGVEIVRKGHAAGQGLGSQDLNRLREKLGKEPMTETQIDRMVQAYAKRLHALNTETVARTINNDAQRAGHRASWEDAIDQGTVDPGTIRRVWVTAGDDRVRPEHAALNGKEVAWDELYPNGELIPGENTFNCRCIERIIITRESRALAA